MCANNAENAPSKNPSLTNEPIVGTGELADSRYELHGWHLTWGATPLYINSKQMDVYRILNKRIQRSAPKSTPGDVKEFVSQHFMSRFFQRQDRNDKSFNDRGLIVIENLDEQYEEILCAAIDGSSNPNDLLKLREKLDMPSIELARLTHPYGTHMETLDEMRQAIDFAIESNGGELIDDDSMTTYGVDGAHIRDKGENIELGFLMKRKRVRGILRVPDRTVVMERSTFVLRVDEESRLDQDIARQFRSIKIDKNPDWNKQVMEVINANNLMPELLINNEFDIAIPLSTTTYAYNPWRVYELDEAEKNKRASKCDDPEWLAIARKRFASDALQLANSNYPTKS